MQRLIYVCQISIKLRVLNAVPKLIAYIGLLPAFGVIYISTSVANELKPHQQLETVQQNETIINSESNF